MHQTWTVDAARRCGASQLLKTNSVDVKNALLATKQCTSLGFTTMCVDALLADVKSLSDSCSHRVLYLRHVLFFWSERSCDNLLFL